MRVGGARPSGPRQRGRLVLEEGGKRPGTRRPRRGMEWEAAVAADVIWPWAEQVMEKGIVTPQGGKLTDGKLNPMGTLELTGGGGFWAGGMERVERSRPGQRWAAGLRGSW